MKIYFGVLETLSSNTYLQYSGWMGTGGWSIKGDGVTSFEHEVGEICKAYNIPLIGWSDLTLCQHWTTICADDVHPDTEAYKHMGEYITGKISKYFY